MTTTTRKGTQFEHGGKKYTAYLSCKFGQYNCGVKMVGRLQLHIFNSDGSYNTGYFEKLSSALEPHKDRIIAEFTNWLSLRETHDKLNKGNEFFPSDTGIYPPGVLVYADHCGYIGTAAEPTPWYSTWQSLIHELEVHPQHGWLIVKSPIYTNFYYRKHGGDNHPSRCWILFPTYARSTVAVDGNNPFKGAKAWAKTYYPEDIADMLSPEALHGDTPAKVAAAPKPAANKAG